MKQLGILGILLTVSSMLPGQELTIFSTGKKNNERFGLKDNAGTIVLQPTFKWLRNFSSFFVYVENGNKGVINAAGKIITPPKYYGVEDLYENRVFTATESYENLWAIIDSSGKELTPFKYTGIDFRWCSACNKRGFAKVTVGSYMGFVNSRGQEVIPPDKYTSVNAIYNNNNLYFEVLHEDGTGIFDTTGKAVSNFKFATIFYFDEYDVALCRYRNGEYGVINRDYVEIFPAGKYKSVSMKEGKICVMENNKYGFLNTNGEIAVPFIYESAKDFSAGMAIVKKNGKWGIIDREGAIVIPLLYDEVERRAEQGIIRVRTGDSWKTLSGFGTELNKEEVLSRAFAVYDTRDKLNTKLIAEFVKQQRLIGEMSSMTAYEKAKRFHALLLDKRSPMLSNIEGILEVLLSVKKEQSGLTDEELKKIDECSSFYKSMKTELVELTDNDYDKRSFIKKIVAEELRKILKKSN